MEQKFNDLTREYCVSAREYFYVLRLAIYHVDGVATDKSIDVARYEKSDEIYRVAINILNAMYRVGGFKK